MRSFILLLLLIPITLLYYNEYLNMFYRGSSGLAPDKPIHFSQIEERARHFSPDHLNIKEYQINITLHEYWKTASIDQIYIISVAPEDQTIDLPIHHRAKVILLNGKNISEQKSYQLPPGTHTITERYSSKYFDLTQLNVPTSTTLKSHPKITITLRKTKSDLISTLGKPDQKTDYAYIWHFDYHTFLKKVEKSGSFRITVDIPAGRQFIAAAMIPFLTILASLFLLLLGYHGISFITRFFKSFPVSIFFLLIISTLSPILLLSFTYTTKRRLLREFLYYPWKLIHNISSESLILFGVIVIVFLAISGKIMLTRITQLLSEQSGEQLPSLQSVEKPRKQIKSVHFFTRKNILILSGMIIITIITISLMIIFLEDHIRDYLG